MQIAHHKVPHRQGQAEFYVLKLTLDDPHVNMDIKPASVITVFNPTVADLRDCRRVLTEAIDRMVHDATG